jgi:small subunit ribosomal protein S8
MAMSDPLADMLTRIRNATMVKFESVEIPKSKIKVNVAQVLQEEGYIEGWKVTDEGPQGTLIINLKYGPDGESVITGLQRVSKPGLRQYARAGSIPPVLNGLGVSIISTSKGLVTDRAARKSNTGGEILCKVW